LFFIIIIIIIIISIIAISMRPFSSIITIVPCLASSKTQNKMPEAQRFLVVTLKSWPPAKANGRPELLLTFEFKDRSQTIRFPK
jgi:hypothetical protein